MENKIIVVLEFEINKTKQSIENLMKVVNNNKTKVKKASVYTSGV